MRERVQLAHLRGRISSVCGQCPVWLWLIGMFKASARLMELQSLLRGCIAPQGQFAVVTRDVPGKKVGGADRFSCLASTDTYCAFPRAGSGCFILLVTRVVVYSRDHTHIGVRGKPNQSVRMLVASANSCACRNSFNIC